MTIIDPHDDFDSGAGGGTTAPETAGEVIQAASPAGKTRLTTMCQEALKLAARDIRVFPVDRVVRCDGQWESDRDDRRRKNAVRDGIEFVPASDAGKLPLIPGWQKLATTDREQVIKWWSKTHGGWSNANIGCATGPGSGFWVLDIDGAVGAASLARLVERHGPLPQTVTVITHSGGTHYWFKWIEGYDIRNTASAKDRQGEPVLGENIDTRGVGGYAVLPPSRGKSGNVYRWAENCSPDEVEIAEAPQWLLDLAYNATKTRQTTGAKPKIGQRQPVPASDGDHATTIDGLEDHLAQIGDGEGQGGFDTPINQAALTYFGRYGIDTDAAPLIQAIISAVRAATVRNDRTNRDRYLDIDGYLAERVEKARQHVEETNAKHEAKVAEVRERINAFSKTTPIEAVKQAIVDMHKAGVDSTLAKALIAQIDDNLKKRSPGKTELNALADAAYDEHNPRAVAATRAVEKRRAQERQEAEKRGEKVFDTTQELIDAINKTGAMVLVGATMRYIHEHGDGDFNLLQPEAFAKQYAPYQVMSGTDAKATLVAGVPLWERSEKRRHYRGLAFEPDGCAPEYYNMWAGWPLTPEAGDWSRMRSHLRERICRNDPDVFSYHLEWLRNLYQEPGNKPGTAVIYVGPQGVGKSLFGRWLMQTCGRYALSVSKSGLITGDFSGHLEGKLVAILEEAHFAGDKAADSAMKDLITSERMFINPKHVGAFETSNHMRVIMYSNAAWALAATDGARRYFVVEVDPTYADSEDPAQQQRNAAYYAPILAQERAGGPAAMLNDFLRMESLNLDLRRPPKTAALAGQAVESFSQKRKWWLSILQLGGFPDADDGKDGIDLAPIFWADNGELEVEARHVVASYRASVRGIHGQPTEAEIGKFLRDVVPNVKSKRTGKKKVPHYIFPPLKGLRDGFARQFSLSAAEGLWPDEPEAPEDNLDSTSRVFMLAANSMLCDAIEADAFPWYARFRED